MTGATRYVGGAVAAVAIGCTGAGRGTAGPSEPGPAAGASGDRADRQDALAYPEARRGDVVDDYHGTEVPDPYRWLEDTDSAETHAWIEAQNRLTFGFLGKIPEREPIRDRLAALWDYEKYGVPRKREGRYFFTKNTGTQPQDVLYWADSLGGEAHVLVDPNALSDDGTVALAGYSISRDGERVAYGLQEAGSDWAEWRVRDVKSGRDLPDRLRWIKFSTPTFAPDGDGLFYSRYPEPEEGESLAGQNLDQKLYYHRIGTPQSDDVLLYHDPEHPEWMFSAGATDDGEYLVVMIRKGTGPQVRVSQQRLDDLELGGGGRPAALEPVIPEFEHDFRFIGSDGPTFWFITDRGAPRRKVVAIDVRDPAPDQWTEIVPESNRTLESANVVGGRLFLSYLQDAHSVVEVFSTGGERQGRIELPGIGSVGRISGLPHHDESLFSFVSFTTPPTIYRYDIDAGIAEAVMQPDVAIDPDDYVTEQIFYESKDGTRVPMFVSHKRGLEPDGERPTILYGYGGFDISLTPTFSLTRILWMELGGVYAVANIRGGGEYGEAWHEAGTVLDKQNVFDDFIAAAEWLTASGFTRSDKLAIQGGSNGGLLVGACMTQRPELFGAALPAVGVMDMLRFHEFTIGHAWVSDYGSSEDPDQFEALYAYSPYHNLEPGTDYPATLVTTADHDDRVVPGHSFKFTAALQRAHAGDDPVLIRVQTEAGHGAGKPTAMQIAELSDKLAFLVKVLDVEVPTWTHIPEAGGEGTE